MTLFHELVKQYNMTLLTTAVVSDGADIKGLITRLAVSVRDRIAHTYMPARTHARTDTLSTWKIPFYKQKT